MLLFKLLLFFLGLASILIVMKGGQLIDEKYGYLAVLYIFISPLFVQHFVKFENDAFATPLIYLAMYILLHAKLNPENHYKKLALALGILAIAALIWNAAGLVMIAAAVEYAVIFFAIMPMLFLYGKDAFAAIASNPLIKENTPGLGMLVLFILLYGFLFSPLSGMTLFLGIVTFLNGKYGILVLPLLAWGIVKALQDHFFVKYRNYVIGMAITIGIMSGLVGAVLFPPTLSHWDSVDSAIGWHNTTGKPIINDFWYGYLLDYKGYVSKFYGFYEEGWIEHPEGNIVLTDQNISCEILDEFNGHYVYNC